MKKIKIAIILISAFFVNTFAYADKQIQVYKYGRGPNGFAYITEIHNATNESLSCLNPGWSPCNWVIRPTLSLVTSSGNTIDCYDQVVARVEQQIAQGISSDNFTFENQILVTYTSTDLENYKLNISTQD